MASEQPACRRCRTQKLRCDRQLPRCARCTRAAADCSYPEPPDRKLIAARRKPPRSRNDGLKSSSPIKPPATVVAVGANLASDDERLLIKIYFTYIFKATLIFHRPTFEQSYDNGSLPRHTLLSVLALSTNFLVVETPHNREYRAQLQHLGDFRKTGEEYALAAGKEVLKDIDEPSLQSIQTCHNLGFFWFARGDSHRNATFSGISYRATRSLLMDTSLRSSQTWLYGETIRRCFWAGWLQTCVNSDDYVTGSAADRLALDTTLPISEAGYTLAIEEPSKTLAEALAQTVPDETLSIWAQFLTFLFFWARVRDHIALRKTTTTNEMLTGLLTLQQNLNDWLTTLHPSMVYSKKHLFEQVIYKQDSIFSTLHAMQHHCRLTLHSSLVPRFSGKLSTDLPVEVIKLSTEASIRSAGSMAELASDLIAFECDFAMIPPYMGYCMYVAGSIHVTMINSPALGESARRNLSLNLALLQGMRPFWTILDRLWLRLVAMCEAQVAKGLFSMESILPAPYAIDNNPDSLDRPIPQYSLTETKREAEIDERSAADTMSKLQSPSESPATKMSAFQTTGDTVMSTFPDASLEALDFQHTPFDFDALANNYGDDWWQLDPTISRPADLTGLDLHQELLM